MLLQTRRWRFTSLCIKAHMWNISFTGISLSLSHSHRPYLALLRYLDRIFDLIINALTIFHIQFLINHLLISTCMPIFVCIQWSQCLMKPTRDYQCNTSLRRQIRYVHSIQIRKASVMAHHCYQYIRTRTYWFWLIRLWILIKIGSGCWDQSYISSL